jgi:hypothetical protein
MVRPTPLVGGSAQSMPYPIGQVSPIEYGVRRLEFAAVSTKMLLVLSLLTGLAILGAFAVQLAIVQ